jgi:hypothetical protein
MLKVAYIVALRSDSLRSLIHCQKSLKTGGQTHWVAEVASSLRSQRGLGGGGVTKARAMGCDMVASEAGPLCR